MKDASSDVAALGDAAQTHTVVLGAGPAGLAVAACLERVGVPCLVLEQADEVAMAWRGHYERLHLHTDKRHSELPGFPFPRDYLRYPSRVQVIEYLEAYARHFRLEPRFGQRVVAARPADGAWEVRTQDARYRSVNLVIATGYNRDPYCPAWPGQASFTGPILHSSRYRNGEPFENQRVLVVGFGNSGGEIAIDLWEHGARPSLAVRGPVNVLPREVLGIPILAFGLLQSRLPPTVADALSAPILRAVVGDLRRYGLRKSPYGPLTQIRREARIPLIDVGTIELIKRGQVSVFAAVESFTENVVEFTDGRRERFDAVILATGYRPRVTEFLEGASAACDESGTPLVSGQEGSVPGLYFCGFRVSPSGMLREIAREARRIGDAIAASRAGGTAGGTV